MRFCVYYKKTVKFPPNNIFEIIITSIIIKIRTGSFSLEKIDVKQHQVLVTSLNNH